MKIYLSRILFLALFLPLNVFADLSDCKDEQTGLYYMHCAYMTGLNESDMSDGRYVKFEMNGKINGVDVKLKETLCINNGSTMLIDPQLINLDLILGVQHTSVSICTDKTGENCEKIKDYTVTVAKKDGIYSVEPKLVEIALAPYVDKYPRCKADSQMVLFKKKLK